MYARVAIAMHQIMLLYFSPITIQVDFAQHMRTDGQQQYADARSGTIAVYHVTSLRVESLSHGVWMGGFLKDVDCA